MIAAEMVAEAAVGGAVADAIAADVRRVLRAGAICLPRSMHRRKVANPGDTIIAVDTRAVMTIGARKFRAARHLP